MSSERIKKNIILFLVFSSLILLSYILITDFIDLKKMHSLEQNAYELFDKISNVDNEDITIDNDITNINIDNSIKLPQKGIIKKNDNKIYAVLYSNKYCSYKKYEEGVLTSKKVNTYNECLDLSKICLIDKNYCK